MAKKGGPSIKVMHILFGVASLLMLITTVLVFVQDYQREFRAYQDEYENLELQRLGAERQQAADQLAAEDVKAEIDTMRQERDKAKADLDAQQGDIAAARKAIEDVDNVLQLGVRMLNFDKADYDTLKYEVDAGRKTLAHLKAQDEKVQKQFAFVEGKKAEKEALRQKIASMEAEYKEADRRLTKANSDIDDLEVKIKKTRGSLVINMLKDAPGLDFIEPRRHIEQVVLPHLPVNVFFANTQRIDRCVSCHKAIDNPDPMYRDASKVPMVLRSHPRLDLYLGTSSKHSYKTFGCTVCHQGRPMGVSFDRAAHMPRDANQAAEWKKKYNWEPMHYWDQKMLPLQHTEASCLKCHKGLDEVPQAHKLNEGRELFRDRGCANCHMGTSGDKDMAWVGRVGPDLRRIGEKASLDWVRHWVYDPTQFRPSTKMPRFFGLENRKDLKVPSDGEPVERDPVEVEAIATYLFATSKMRESAPPEPPAGDADAGRKLFEVVGCLACHNTEDAPQGHRVHLNKKPHGPDLGRVGDKLSAGWLFAWLRSPRHYWAETKMPNLRLSEKEAADITAYLMTTMKDSSKKLEKLPSAAEKSIEQIIIDKLAATATPEKIRSQLDDPQALVVNSLKKKVKYLSGKDTGDGEWTQPQIDKIVSVLNEMPDKARAFKAFNAGETLIQHHGCFGCHNIQGWTFSPLTCVNLAGEADKDLEKFDFGKTLHDEHHSIPHTKWDWFYNKIARPRVYDSGKLDLIKPYDRLRMPWFGVRKDDAHGEGGHAEGAAGGGHAAHGPYHALSNPDLAEGSQGLTETEIQRLVTHLLSLTTELIPEEMRHKPSPQAITLDRGHRVIRELNCNGCHLVGIDPGPRKDMAVPDKLPLEALVALTTPQARGIADNNQANFDHRMYFNEDIVSLNFASKAGAESSLDGFVNIQRGTFLTGITAPVALNEKMVRSGAMEPQQRVGLTLEKKGKNDNWVEYGSAVSPEKFKSLTLGVFFVDGLAKNKSAEELADEAYERLKVLYVDMDAYERAAGTLALKEARLITVLDVEKRKAERKFYEPAWVQVRYMRGEGRIIPQVLKAEAAQGLENPSQQVAPPSLSYEGGKVQPDWLYQFLHEVHTLREGLKVRMPSFWTPGPYSKYKAIYPAGRLSAVDPLMRDGGIAGEPAPSPEALKIDELPDDAQQVVDFFIQDAGVKPYGFQPKPLTSEEKAFYEAGRKLLFADEKVGGKGCTNCHGVGQRKPNEPKWAPNLASVQRRLKSDWVRRFLTNPSSIYPWTNMPNNFGFDWAPGSYNPKLNDPHRGILDSSDQKFEENARQLNALRFYLMHAGQDELGNEAK